MQLSLLEDEGTENPRYLSEQLVTYLGNKRALLQPIELVVRRIRHTLGGRRLRACDPFSGSGVVSRMLKQHSYYLVSNDFESYAACIGRAYLTNRSTADLGAIGEIVSEMNRIVENGGGATGFIREMYSPVDDENIQPGERVFYTAENARRLDAYAQLIHDADISMRDLLLGPLLSEASIHANTAGVFKGFYKDRFTGVGRYGGNGENALNRIRSPIRLSPLILSNYDNESVVYQEDAADLPALVDELDLVYLDPPYNQHPYGSNYFMLNLLVSYQKPGSMSEVSGIPEGWRRSLYNKRREAFPALADLVKRMPSRFVLLSFSDDGFLDPSLIRDLFESLGQTEVIDIPYNTYRGSRNLSGRSLKVTEHLFFLDRGDA